MSRLTIEVALAALENAAEPARAAQMTSYHKQKRRVLGVPNPVINSLSQEWRQQLTAEGDGVAARCALAQELWASDVFEARIAAAKLLTQARIKEDAEVWELLQSWLADFDSWAIADHAASAIQKRLQAQPERLDTVEGWTASDHMWTRRAALVSTLPWAKLPNPKAEELATRERILGWAATYVPDRNWFIQKAIAWWLRDLSKHDADRSSAFLAEHGAAMKPFARKEAAKYLPASESDPTGARAAQ
ncbi:DNA alkylation repair protein [Phaeobacter gallaeciensis]|uniref:DNA alkylation repair enzyme n=1 Tax=Phaeobacter gallaeciensis TaxID=60890 RepID=A0AAC9ZAM2_9RHOB|nr:DNA alkylation repair protein [Phaeobacter gallaeciensis]AHD10215.1 putative DNA alkylation repair enzyme [Phaeobacter gallaeciensis DSM 26640]ATE93479.1 putative DNA alkylation repair enzyme [Phaeobacter gallaeciensis]ATE96700.1 putative DNA alkylation repair enzyme [Phaeobacter gallaeciensis]ATF02143.1 putative DNA alkylation repair enzyme [Phaeobacter gallaeciensis]ATF06523.1 putative DNA alkylation repair enzyme [Phaeobacter gallaeciensis]